VSGRLTRLHTVYPTFKGSTSEGIVNINGFQFETGEQ
jgi:hypothetical protein